MTWDMNEMVGGVSHDRQVEYPMTDKRTSLYKALTYRFFSIILVALMVYLLTGQMALAASIGAVDALLKVSLYYVHERAWIWGLEKWSKK